MQNEPLTGIRRFTVPFGVWFFLSCMIWFFFIGVASFIKWEIQDLFGVGSRFVMLLSAFLSLCATIWYYKEKQFRAEMDEMDESLEQAAADFRATLDEIKQELADAHKKSLN